jgi:hypothetical protein
VEAAERVIAGMEAWEGKVSVAAGPPGVRVWEEII